MFINHIFSEIYLVIKTVGSEQGNETCKTKLTKYVQCRGGNLTLDVDQLDVMNGNSK